MRCAICRALLTSDVRRGDKAQHGPPIPHAGESDELEAYAGLRLVLSRSVIRVLTLQRYPLGWCKSVGKRDQ